MTAATATKKEKRVLAASGKEYIPPKRLSKAAMFMRNYPNGVLTIVDMRAVMK